MWTGATYEVLERKFLQRVGEKPIVNLVLNESSVDLVYGALFRSRIDCLITELHIFLKISVLGAYITLYSYAFAGN